jgi:7-cyano-7-deazaguanine synthase
VGANGGPVEGYLVAMAKAIVLLSGGLDSAVALAIARSESFETHALTFDYGQRHAGEIEAARRVAESLGASTHRVFKVPLQQFGGSALTGDVEVPKDRALSELSSGVPSTYVPARNTVFLALALALAECVHARHLFIGVNALDYSGYPDCRPEFVEAFERLANLATKAGVEGELFAVRAPLLHWTKAQIVRKGLELGVDFSLTRSCYDPSRGGLPCGRCDACLLRRRAFEEAGVADPAEPREARG